jgi:hypothetical protein
MTQVQTVTTHLQTYNSISALEAQSNYGIWRLAAVINRLRNRGTPIVMQMKTAPNGARYAEYKLQRK